MVYSIHPHIQQFCEPKHSGKLSRETINEKSYLYPEETHLLAQAFKHFSVYSSPVPELYSIPPLIEPINNFCCSSVRKYVWVIGEYSLTTTNDNKPIMIKIEIIKSMARVFLFIINRNKCLIKTF